MYYIVLKNMIYQQRNFHIFLLIIVVCDLDVYTHLHIFCHPFVIYGLHTSFFELIFADDDPNEEEENEYNEYSLV